MSAQSAAALELLRSLGSEPMRIEGGGEVAAHFGAVEAEYQALVEGVGIVARNWPDHLRVRGEDRIGYLNGKVTCEIEGVGPGEGVYGFILDAKGHIQADTVIRVFQDEVWLELPWGRGPRILEHLQRFIVIDRVEIEPLADRLPVTLIGPRVPALQSSLSEVVALPDRPWQIGRSALVEGIEIPVSADGRWGGPAVTFWPSVSGVPDLIRALLSAGRRFDARLVGFQAADRVRIEAGIPWFGRDFDEANLPQETGEDEAVSYRKGCYLGQEVVARLHFRGQVSKVLCGLEFAVDETPEVGTALALEDRRAGTLTSATVSPRLGSVVGLAMLQRRAAQIGTRLDVEGGGRAEVVRSPLTS